MNKKLLFKSLMVFIFSFSGLNAFAAIDWVGNMFPSSGSSTTITEGTDHTVYVQVYKDGVTNSAGQGAGIMCELYYGDVDAFGMPWNNVFTQAMTYNVDIGNNDEYQATIAPGANLYELTCRCSDDGGTSWTFADLPSGNAMLTVDASLPVELSDFSAYQKANEVELQWITQNEIANRFFAIEKSIDLRSWEIITEIEGQGTSYFEQDYNFIDENPYQGLNYYRLKQVDFNGDYSYSETISIEFRKSGINVFPNPIDEFLNINLEATRDATVEIFNLHGQLIQSVNIENEQNETINMLGLNSGVYLIRVIDKSGFQLFNEMIVKR